MLLQRLETLHTEGEQVYVFAAHQTTAVRKTVSHGRTGKHLLPGLSNSGLWA